MTWREGAIRLRPATAADARLLWSWRNEKTMRQNAFDTRRIAWQAHAQWFASRLSSASCRIWILEMQAHPAGQIRYERLDDVASIHFAVDKKFRGMGLGTHLLRASAPMACAELSVQRLVGLVKVGNIPSEAAFKRAGFREVEQTLSHGAPCTLFARQCTDTAK